MLITSAEFVTSAVRPQQYPPADLPEFAFAGRSNVGKSSLINTLVSRKKLVLTSSSPGKTRLINFFRVNDALMFVDLPGYGYARVSEDERRKWRPMIEKYLSGRENLKAVVVILDIRRTPNEEDAQLLHWLARREIPEHTTFVSSTPAPSSVSGRVYTFNIGTVAGGASGTVTITVKVDAGPQDGQPGLARPRGARSRRCVRRRRSLAPRPWAPLP